MTELIGEEKLIARLEALRKAGKPVLGLLAITAVAEQKRLVPRKTGNLGRTIHVGRVTATYAETVASASYAPHVEYGTRPHEIRPKRKKALRFPSSGSSTTLSGRLRAGGGGFMFAKVVHHPGTKAQPFMVPGAQRAIKIARLKDVLVKAWNSGA